MSEFDSPEIFQSVLETLPTGVYLVDRNRKIVFWNTGAETISGHLRQDVVGRFLREHLLAASEQLGNADGQDSDALCLAFRDGKSTTEHVSMLHKKGYRVPIVLRTVPIRNMHGTVIGAAECFEENSAWSDRARRRADIVEMGRLDEVTGTPERSFMEAKLREQLEAGAEHHTFFGILLIQISQMDHFRAACGPAVVPIILRIAGQTIENSLRPSDILGCWSENLFLALLMDCKESEVGKVATRIVKMIGQSEVEWWGDKLSVSAVFGGAGSRPEDTVELLIARAIKSLQENVVAGEKRIPLVS